MTREWVVICKPESGYEAERNVGGLSVLLTDGKDEHEVSRVAYARQDSRNPDVSFGDQLQNELEKAQEAAESLNALMGEYEAVQREKAAKARSEIRDLFGSRPGGKLM